MSLKSTLCAATALSLITAGGAFADNLTIATVNNGDMIRMQGLTDDLRSKRTYSASVLLPISPPKVVLST